jgi:FkbM family methyltransferase
MGLNIIQIGSHKGDDDLTKIIKNIKSEDISKIILVEPQQEFNTNLNDVYNGYNITIENIVITPNENETEITFYSCSEDLDKEISSIKKEHLFKHNKYNFNETKIKCLTLNSLLLKHNIFDLDLLFIDAEGIDGEIIKSIDFEKFNIKKIFYENLHINNMQIKKFLEEKNFSIKENVLTNGWTNEAIKNN